MGVGWGVHKLHMGLCRSNNAPRFESRFPRPGLRTAGQVKGSGVSQPPSYELPVLRAEGAAEGSPVPERPWDGNNAAPREAPSAQTGTCLREILLEHVPRGNPRLFLSAGLVPDRPFLLPWLPNAPPLPGQGWRAARRLCPCVPPRRPPDTRSGDYCATARREGGVTPPPRRVSLAGSRRSAPRHLPPRGRGLRSSSPAAAGTCSVGQAGTAAGGRGEPRRRDPVPAGVLGLRGPGLELG